MGSISKRTMTIKIVVIFGAITYFISGVLIVAFFCIWLNLPASLAAIFGMIVGLTTVPLLMLAWDKWVK